MTDQVLKTIKTHNMLAQDDVVILGLSGGADSVALLYLLRDLSADYHLTLVCVHVNHGVRGAEAQADQQFVASLCEALGVPLTIVSADVPKMAKQMHLTIEEAGRQVRYRAFQDACLQYGGTKIAVAHNQNDQAETLLYRLCRGAGQKGLGGIRPVRDNIIRPLLYCTRQQIETYCADHRISYQTDSTNLQENYTRNKIRLKLLPALQEQLNTNIVETLSRTADLLREEDEFLEVLARQALVCCVRNEESKLLIDVHTLDTYDLVLKRRIIRNACVQFSPALHDISHEHVRMILSLQNAETGKTIVMPNGLRASRRYDDIFIYKQPDNQVEFLYTIPLDTVVFIKEIQKSVLITCQTHTIDQNHTNCYTKIFDYDRIYGNFTIRTRREGDKIYFKSMNGNKKVKNLFIDLKIPRDKRERVPILCHEDDVMWVVGFGASDLYSQAEHTKNKFYVHIWEEPHE